MESNLFSIARTFTSQASCALKMRALVDDVGIILVGVNGRHFPIHLVVPSLSTTRNLLDSVVVFLLLRLKISVPAPVRIVCMISSVLTRLDGISTIFVLPYNMDESPKNSSTFSKTTYAHFRVLQIARSNPNSLLCV
jgi:hypothetical protein